MSRFPLLQRQLEGIQRVTAPITEVKQAIEPSLTSTSGYGILAGGEVVSPLPSLMAEPSIAVGTPLSLTEAYAKGGIPVPSTGSVFQSKSPSEFIIDYYQGLEAGKQNIYVAKGIYGARVVYEGERVASAPSLTQLYEQTVERKYPGYNY